jgi:hypothetical protein
MQKLSWDNVVNLKQMKKHYLYLIAFVLFSSCTTEDEDFKYNSRDNVYFGISNLVELSEDEVLDFWPEDILIPAGSNYSFATSMKASDTVYFPVSISGKRVSHDRHFKVVVDNDSSTAESDKHFAPLKEFYTIPANSGSALVPVLLYNTDLAMEVQTFYLRLKLVPSEDFGVGNPAYEGARLHFSNRLEKTAWWDPWSGELGSYTRTKHALYLISLHEVDNKDLTLSLGGEDGLLIPYCLYLIGKFEALLIDPFGWVEANPEYALDEVAAGVYEFYSVENPAKKYTLLLHPDDGKYYFKDENGARVSTSL